jgi:predicted AlkP superfamily pyrophosphatase or phosphodiesterase
MVSACFFWPGSEAAINGVRPAFSVPYDEKIPNNVRIRRVMEWLRLPPERRPHVITLYFSELDSASHRNRLDSPAIERAARSLDHSVGALLDGIDSLPIRDRVYLLITSDHGMVETGRTRTIVIESLVSLNGVEQTFDGPVTSLHVRGSDLARAGELRDQLNARLEHGRAYLRQDLAEELHYRNDPRAGDVVVIMDESWALRRAGVRTLRPGRWGMHGWHPNLPSMRAVFLALGPDIRAGAIVDPVENIDVYPFMTEVLGLRPPAGIDGRPGRLVALLANPKKP